MASLSRPNSTIIEVKYKVTTDAGNALPFTFSVRTNPLETLSVAPQPKLAGGGLLGLDARISALAPSICPLVLLVQKWDELLPLWQNAHDDDPAQTDYLALTLEDCLQRLLGNGTLTTGSRTIGGVQQAVVTSIWELWDPDLAPDKTDALLHYPVSDGLARMVRYLNSNLSAGLDAEGGDAQKNLEILQSMRRALQPVLDAAAGNEGADANWKSGTIGTQRSQMVLQAMAQCMADTETTRFLLAAWLAMRAVAARVSGAPFGQLWLRILRLVSAQIAVRLIMYPILKVADGPDTLLTSKDVAGIGTREIAPH